MTEWKFVLLISKEPGSTSSGPSLHNTNNGWKRIGNSC
jgi:hypothetical protein